VRAGIAPGLVGEASSVPAGVQETARVMEKARRMRSLVMKGGPTTMAKWLGVLAICEVEVVWPRARDVRRVQKNPLALALNDVLAAAASPAGL
jgi:hypothetical protein